MVPHSGTLAWKIPWTERPGRLQSMGSLGVGHNWATSLWLFTFMHWRRKWQPTPVLLPGESQGREPGGLPSMGSHRVGHDWSDLAAVAAGRQKVIKFSENLLERILCFTNFNKSNLRFPITLTAKPIQVDFFGESTVLLFLCEFSYQLYFVKSDFWDWLWWILRKV